MKSPEKVIKHIVDWLNNYVDKSGMNGFVVGVSGGIDSALTSTLCALTGKPVLCLEMPIYQELNQVTRAKEHIAWLEKKYSNVKHYSLSLTGIFNSLQETLPPTTNEESKFLSLANTRARLRMTTLYYFAALERKLVAGTGNKIEDFGVGFYTKYGDGGVDLSPIADLMKSEVFLLAETLGVIKSIQNAAPTDGLWGDDRTDEDQIGATYDELEWAMKNIEANSVNNTIRQNEVLLIYKKLHGQNLHKMQPIPVCEIPESL
tara:strand:- start:14521 stop:15303 length:783 start_codon:yes stop_codon:yes gene_type:complete